MFLALAAARRLAALHGLGTFEETYRCLPPSAASHLHLEDGDKVLLPVSALHRLTTLRVDYPMLFQLRAAADPDDDQPHRTSHCGVLEFVADEGTVVMPRWMMANLRLGEGAAVRVRSAAALPKGAYVKIRPHTSAFLDVSNPKAVLEKTLRTFTCFTTGDTIMVSYNGKSYYIDIVETRPAQAVSIVDTDCEVDFAPPLDYKEPDKPPVRLPAPPAVAVPASGSKAAAGDGAAVKREDEPKFKPFTGSGNRLDGKASAAPSGSSSGGKQQQASAAPVAASSGASSSSGRHKSGKLVFGSSSGTSNVSSSKEEPHKAVAKQQAEAPPKTKDEPKFQAFTGKSYSLMKR